jgi:hypothetical protein
MTVRVAVPFQTQPADLGLRAGLNYDDVADLLARAEAEDFK